MTDLPDWESHQEVGWEVWEQAQMQVVQATLALEIIRGFYLVEPLSKIPKEGMRQILATRGKKEMSNVYMFVQYY